MTVGELIDLNSIKVPYMFRDQNRNDLFKSGNEQYISKIVGSKEVLWWEPCQDYIEIGICNE